MTQPRQWGNPEHFPQYPMFTREEIAFLFNVPVRYLPSQRDIDSLMKAYGLVR